MHRYRMESRNIIEANRRTFSPTKNVFEQKADTKDTFPTATDRQDSDHPHNDCVEQQQRMPSTTTAMGRHDHDAGGRHHKHERETEEERLMRKAREYVERHKNDDDDANRGGGHNRGGKKSSKKSRHDDRRHSKKSEKRRERSDDDDDRERSKKRHRKEHRRDDDHKKKKKKKESKRDKHDKERRHKKHESRKRIKKSDLYPLGAIRGSPPTELLDVEKDYFTQHQNLWVYLYREEGIVFGDLTSDDAHSAFKRFVKRYNAGQLETAYYEGLPNEAVDECKTTNHKWAFNTSETERKSLQFLQEGVRKQTEYEGAANTPASIAPRNEPASSIDRNVARLPPPNERRRPTQEERLAERTANRRLKEHVRTSHEELTGGRKEGRERQIEKRREKAETIHGAAKDREDARMGGVELNDEAIYGAGDGGFQDALARERQRKAQRQQKKDDRVAQLKKKEQEKQDAMIKMLGLTGVKPGQKIKIAPRDDG